MLRAEYLRCARQFAAHYRVSPEQLGAEDVRRYLLHLVEDLHFSPANMKNLIAAIKFLSSVPLDRPEVVARVHFPKVPVKLLDIPSASELAAVLSELTSPVYRTLLFCAYGAGLPLPDESFLSLATSPLGSEADAAWPRKDNDNDGLERPGGGCRSASA